MKSKMYPFKPEKIQLKLNLLLCFLLFLGAKTFAQSPELTVKGEEAQKVRMSQLIVNVKVVGNIAYTTAEMHFFNSGNRQMEAELIFPLPENVSVSRYAIDINGKMREAVPVNKNKGKQVFEAIEHRRVDPGLLEKVDGNNFRTRIYPLMPNGERIVIIGYEEELAAFDKNNLAYQLVSRYPVKLDKFELNVSVLGAAASPTIAENSGEEIAFSKWNQSFQTSLKKENYQPSEKLLFKIPIQQNIPSVVMQTVQDQHYFYGSTFIEGNKIAKKMPASIGLVWDNSLSCQNRDLKKELDLLDAYFQKIKNTTVSLYFLNYTFEKDKDYVISNGNWSALKSVLQSTKYDGGTRFSKINLPNHDEFLFFSDGLSSLSENVLPKTNKPIYTITSSVSADFTFLNYASMKTGGNFINLNQLNPINALDKLTNNTLKFLGIKENLTVTDLYPMKGASVSGNFSFAGISLNPKNEITLLFGYSGEAILERKITLDAAVQNTTDVSIEKLWAQKKIANLDLQYDKNAEEIEILGKKYGIITKNTSLIVLEELRDYMAYDIVPPAELRAEFDRIKKQEHDSSLARQKNNWESVEGYFTELNSWWTQDIKYVMPKVLPKSKQKKRRGSETIQSSSNSVMVSEGVGVSGISATPPPSAQEGDQVKFVSPVVARANEITEEANANKEKREQAETISGTLNFRAGDINFDKTQKESKTWNPDRLYLKALAAAPKEKQYELYFELRKVQERNPSFYFDVAHFFYNQGDVKKALQVISNIADLGLENHQLYKTLTYTLRQWKAYDDALFTAKQIAKWRAHEPQSLRDYALALEDAGKYQEAFDQLIKALEVNYYGEMSGQYEGVEDIILMDINRLMLEHKGLNSDKLDKKYLKEMPIDIRVVMNWNLMDVDLDLHIIEPTGEECYYGHTVTQAGAKFSKDFTQGYGPEQYLIRNAVKGKYQIKTNYFGERELTESGPATVMIEIYTTKEGKTTRVLKTIQLGKVKENELLAEIVW